MFGEMPDSFRGWGVEAGMVWRELSVVEQRREFVMLASLAGANVSALCARFGISRQTGYVWLRRFAAGEDLTDRSRRPRHSPRRVDAGLEAAILRLRAAHPAWGARKLAWCLAQQGMAPPAVSSVHAVLVRHGRIGPAAGAPHAYGRFEREAPNMLWQMDFKGRVQLACGSWCHTLTVIDDHSRFAIALAACANERTGTVQQHLEAAFRRHGLPAAIYCDNGAPWGGGVPGQWTPLRVWLLKLGVQLIHSRPYYPQGRGKNERFHRSLLAEVFALVPLQGLAEAQAALDQWRHVYNRQRPHQALGLAVPASRYRPSALAWPESLPQPAYAADDIVRRVGTSKAYVAFNGRAWKVPQAFAGETLAIRPRLPLGSYAICFGATQIATIDLKQPPNPSP
jgi:transposase InsO family protein